MAFLPTWMHGLTPEMVKRAKEELGETPEIRKKALEELRHLIDGEMGFHPVMDESFLLRFLRSKKFNVQRAFRTLKNYYAFKTRYSDIVNVRPSDIKHILEMDKILIPNKRCPNGGGLMIMFIGSYDIDLAPVEQQLGASFVCSEIGIETEASQVCGSSVIIDMKGMTWSKMRHYSTPSFLSLVIRGLQDCWPHRVNGFHFVNEPSYFSFTYNIFRPMLLKKLQKRIHFHGDNLKSLHVFIEPEILPEELGGHLEENDFQEFRSYILGKELLLVKLNSFDFQGIKFRSRSHFS